MKTTLILDDDVADFLKERSRLQNKPFKQVVSETLRRGMETPTPAELAAEVRRNAKLPPLKIVPFSSEFQPRVDPPKLKEILAEMDVEDYLRKSSQ